MVPPPESRPSRPALLLPRFCGALAAFVSVLVLCGWLFHQRLLVTLLPDLPAMAVPTALGFLLVSFALTASASERADRPPLSALWARRIPAFLVLSLGMGTLVFYFLTAATSGNALAVSTTSAVSAMNGLVNRTAPSAAVNFILLGAALGLFDTPWHKRNGQDGGDGDSAETAPSDKFARWPYQILALLVAVDGFLGLLGQMDHVTVLYGISRTIAMAFPTALLFLVLGFGLLAARPERGFVAILLSRNAAGQAARRLLPVVVAVPLVLGAVALTGSHVDASLATYLLVVASIGLLVSLFWSTILTLHREVERTVSYSQQVSAQTVALERQKGEIERAAMIVQQRQFVRQMLASVTEGRLCLCDTDSDLSDLLTPASDLVELRAETLRVLRRHVTRVAGDLNLSEERSKDLLTAVGEASMNAVRHGGGGKARVHSDATAGMIQVWIKDEGTGIREEDLHRATLEKGWSGAGSFGHGFYLMLRTVDRTYLLTGAAGTTIVLEQEIVAPKPAWLHDR